MRLRFVWFALALFTWLLGTASYLYLLVWRGNEFAPLLLLFIIPAGIAVVLMILNVCVFPIRYSVFGSLSRRSFPAEKATAEIISWIGVCRFRAAGPTVKWRVYPSGLGIAIFGIGNVFLPADCIRSVEKSRHGWFCVRHASHELRNPVLMPAKVFDAAMAQWR